MPVDTLPPDYLDREADWTACRRCDAGERQIKEAGQVYLPCPEGMDAGGPGYAAYVTRADFFPGYSRALQGLHGMVFRRPLSIEGQRGAESDPSKIIVTSSGRSLDALARHLLRELLLVGRMGLLVDRPEIVPGTVMTIAQARQRNLEPYVVAYAAEDVLEARYAKIDNRRILVLVRLHESFEEVDPDDEFVINTRDRWRVLDLVAGEYRQRTYVRDLSKPDEPIILESETWPTAGGKNLDHIPFYLCDADDQLERPIVPRPPMIDLAFKTLSLYRTLADLEQGAWFCGFPQPYLVLSRKQNEDDPDPEFKIGSGTAWIISDENAKVGLLTHDGNGLGSLEHIRDSKKAEIAILGARMLEPARAMPEAFGTALVHRQGEISVLQALVLQAGNTLSAVMTEIDRWAGASEDAEVTVTLNDDFVPAQVDAATIRVMLEALIAGQMTFEEWWDFLIAGEVIATTKTAEEAKTEIDDAQAALPPPRAPDLAAPGMPAPDMSGQPGAIAPPAPAA